MAEFRWYGHNCFRIRGKDAVVMTDPVGKKTGFTLAKQTADIVTVSSPQPEHANLGRHEAGVRHHRRSRASTRSTTSSSPASAPIRMRRTATQRGHNTSYLIELDGMVICHLGDLGHALSRRAGRGDDRRRHPARPRRAAGISIRRVPPRSPASSRRRWSSPCSTPPPAGDRDLLGLDAFCRNLGVTLPEPEEKLTVKSSDLGDTMRLVVLGVS